MTRISFLLEDKDLNELRKLSKETGAPVSEIMRRAIKNHLKKQNEQDNKSK